MPPLKDNIVYNIPKVGTFRYMTYIGSYFLELVIRLALSSLLILKW